MSEVPSTGLRHPLIRLLSLNEKNGFLGRFLLSELHSSRFESFRRERAERRARRATGRMSVAE